MRIARYAGQLTALVEGGGIDIPAATSGRFSHDVIDAIERWDELAETVSALTGPVHPVDPARLDAPVPMPRQVFAIGLNYRDHAAETGVPDEALPKSPPTFTKFQVCITGSDTTVELPSENVDYEAELVVVIGRRAEHVAREDAWSHVAGLMIGQDLSERAVQLAGPVPQFSLGKSYPGFGPTGPAIVTTDELADPDSLAIGCSVDGQTLQAGNTKDLLFNVPALIAELSQICALLPGDLIFTGTPAGTGMGRKPPRYLAPGETLTTYIESLGELHTTLVAGPGYHHAQAGE